MAKKKKVSRKELLRQEDEFISFSAKILRFVLEHKVQISGTLAILLGLILIISGIRYFSGKAEAKAFAMMDQGLVKYEEIAQESGADKAYTEVKSDFQNLLDKYSGKSAGKLSRIVYANICYNGGETDKAIELYEKALRDFGDDLSLRNFILSGLGYAYEAKKDSQTAIRYFEMITSGTSPILKSEAYYQLGQLYADIGEKEKSQAAFQTILSDYTDSMYIELAKERVPKEESARSS